MLEVNNVVAKYNNITALHGINISVKEGELVSIVGANGAGKSTTLRSIVGLMNIFSGSVAFNGENITKLNTHKIVQKGISLVPEGRMIFPSFTVLENLKAGGYLINDRKELTQRIEHMTELFPILKERFSQKAGTLSGGEQQMLAIARALMQNPKLLLLDEPSLGLAPVIIEKIMELINQLHHTGMTILLVEQDVYAALEIADRGYVIENGLIAAEGNAKDLLNSDLVKKKYLGIA